jgi:hypothetical protein
MSMTITSGITMERSLLPAIPQLQRSIRRHDNHPPKLRLSPLAWLKLQLFLHAGETEVGFFGICASDDLMYVEDLAVPKQKVSAVTVSFDDLSVGDYFEDCAERGIQPSRCGRVWIHTHPGSSALPSSVDEETFARVFGSCDWAVMAIMARGGASYARLSFSAGPGGSTNIPIEVDWPRMSQDLVEREGKLDELFSGWMDEYGSRICPEVWLPIREGITVSPANPSLAHLDPRVELDELYDRMLVEEEIEDLYLDSMREGVFQ